MKHADQLNPYKIGVPRENWRRGFLGESFIGCRNSPAEKYYKEGKRAAKKNNRGR
jgi:hypothetical protein